VEWVEVDSTSIAAIGYDALKSELAIEFRKGSLVYLYSGVSNQEYQQFLNAESKGDYLNRVFVTKAHPYSGPYAQRMR